MPLTQIDYPDCLINLSNSPANLALQPSNITISDNSGNNIVSLSTNAAINTRGALFSDQLNFGNVASKLISYKFNGIHSGNGQVFDLTTDNGMTLQNMSSSLGQVITADSLGKPIWANAPAATWVGTATSPLNMGSNAINVSSIDASGTVLSIGESTASSLVLGHITNKTTLQGNNVIIQAGGSTGLQGQVLTRDLYYTVWGDSPWVPTATSALNMGIYDISGRVLDSNTYLFLGATKATSVIVGNNSHPLSLLSNNLIIETASSPGTMGQVLAKGANYAAWANPAWVGTATSPLLMGSNAITGSTLDASGTTLTLGATNATGVTLGKSGTNTTVAGSLIVNDEISSAISSAINLFTANTGGVASLFTSATRTATLNIQNGSASANIVNIGSVTSATNILGLRAATLDSITSSVLSVGSNVLTTGVNLNNKVLSGLTYGVNQFVTLSTNTAVPSATQIGYVLSTATASATLSAAASGVGFNVFTNLPVPAGVWMINYSVRLQTSSATNSTISIYSFNGSGAQTQGQYGISLSTATYIANNGINSMFGTGSFVVSYTAATNLNIACFFVGTLVGTISMYPTASNLLSATRIA